MAPLTIPQRPQGGRGPLFGLSPGLKLASAFGKTLDGTAERLRRRRELDLFRFTAGQSAALLPDFDESWSLGGAVPANT